MNISFDDSVSAPSISEWLKEAKEDVKKDETGMYLLHNGVVRVSPKEYAREGKGPARGVKSLTFFYNKNKVLEAIDETKNLEGITHIKVWLNKGSLKVGEDIMYVLIGGDIRPNVIDGLTYLVGKIKEECVTEVEEMEDIE